MYRSFLGLISVAALFLTPPSAHASCAVSNGITLPSGTDQITVTGDLEADRSSAINKWEEFCVGAGFNYPNMSTSGTGDLNLHVDFTNGERNDTLSGDGCEVTLIQRRNNVMTGARIKIWAARRDGSPCNASRGDLVAHAIGHSLGLGDVLDSSCNSTIMGRPVPGEEMTMVPEVCTMVQSRWITSAEISGGNTGDGPLDDDTGAGEDTPNWWSEGYGTPIVIDLAANNFRFSDLGSGVFFDLNHDGTPNWVSWTLAGSDDTFLALDRNGNGIIDGGGELFGGFTDQPGTRQPNGYNALAVFDDPTSGGDGDRMITPADRIFGQLLLWRDANHDGASSPAELSSLQSAGITAIDLRYILSNRRDPHGNLLRWTSMVHFGKQRRLSATDVLLLVEY